MRKAACACLVFCMLGRPLAHAAIDPSSGAAGSVWEPRFDGEFRFVGGDPERQALEHAIDGATEGMNILIRGIARDRIRARVTIPARQRFWMRAGNISVASEQSLITAPADGRPAKWRNSVGDDVTVFHRLIHGRIVQDLINSGGSRRTVFEFSPDGSRLHVNVTIRSPRIPKPIRYRLTYRIDRAESSSGA